MKTQEINGVVYETVPIPFSVERENPCFGCVGKKNSNLCKILPDDCLEESIVWKKKIVDIP